MALFTENGLNLKLAENFFSVEASNHMYAELKQLPFFTPIFNVNGKMISPRRKIYGMGDLDYSFSGIDVPAQPWSPAVLKMKHEIEKITGTSYNFALLNYFSSGNAKISMHFESTEKQNNTPAIVCFGTTREVQFKRKNFEDFSIKLTHGSVLCLHNPTNQLFSQGIPEDPTVEGETISVHFKKIKPLELPCKRPKLDWLDILFQNMNEMEPTYMKFSPTAYVVIKEFQHRFFVDIRRYEEKHEKLIPSKKGVMLTAPEWAEFYSKIYDFNFVNENRNGMTSNLMLLNLNGQLHLQQINVTNDFLVFLKYAYIKLYAYEVDQLMEKIQEISRIVKDCLWHEFFPRSFAKSNDETMLMPCDEDTMRSVYRIILEAHFVPIIKKHFVCQGCLVDSNSQLNHDCVNTPLRKQYDSINNIELFVDFPKLFIELNEKRIFTSDFIMSCKFCEIEDTLFVDTNADDDVM